MPTEDQIREGLKRMAKNDGPAVSIIAKVKSVDEDKAICVLIDEDDQDINDVRLRPVLSGNKSFILVPKLETFVLAVRVEDDDDWMVIASDEIEKIGYYLGNTIMEIDATGFLLKKENETLKALMVDFLAAIKNLSFTVSTTGTASAQTGSTTAVVNLAEFEALETRFNQFLK